MTDNDDIKAALPDYLVERELGQGGMGIVFLGRHARLGRLVAIKELPPSFAADPERARTLLHRGAHLGVAVASRTSSRSTTTSNATACASS